MQHFKHGNVVELYDEQSSVSTRDCHAYSGTSLIWTPEITVLISEVSLFQGENNMHLYKVGTWSSVLINQVSLFQRCPLREVPLYLF